MKFDFKNIHIGECIRNRIEEMDLSVAGISTFLEINEEEVCEMFTQNSLSTEVLMKWSKLLQYDFFRVYSQHLVMFAPPGNSQNTFNKQFSLRSRFRKNIYTKELIHFVLEMVNTDRKTKNEIINDYKIPKTTLHKWMAKYNISD
ncbi:transposase [Chryseobacterium indologenes]|uniref:Transposase n=1 Tax=Chryseobacterium indologenes TaxID=253 RepID=A0AAD1DVY4_CHRID|nr:transposase [Chryseobacterium indologenes]AZB19315.1 transposase [Chryseobacterium indologenes]TLX27240.1 transposase [Chryseobacterium indologenes]